MRGLTYEERAALQGSCGSLETIISNDEQPLYEALVERGVMSCTVREEDGWIWLVYETNDLGYVALRADAAQPHLEPVEFDSLHKAG